MTFQDLPDNVRAVPLVEPTVQADVVDLILGESDRREGSMAMMLCDSECRPFQPIVVGGVPEAEAGDCLIRLIGLVSHVVTDETGSVLVARGRPGASVPTDDDRALHQLAIDQCEQHGIRLLGTFVATPGGVTALPEPLTAAS
jgi:hypothetical protein